MWEFNSPIPLHIAVYANLVQHFVLETKVCGFKSHRGYQYTRIAQSGEQHPYKVKVVGSIPTASTNGGLAHLGRALALHARGDGIVDHILHHILV